MANPINENWFGVFNNFISTLGGVLISSNTPSTGPAYVPGAGGGSSVPPIGSNTGVNIGGSASFSGLSTYMPIILIVGLILILKK